MASTWACKSNHSKWVSFTTLEVLYNMKRHQRLFNENLCWWTTLWRVIQTLEKYINKREATYKCCVAQVHWAFLRFSIVQVNMSFTGFVEVFIVCWKMRLWVNVSGWFEGHCKINTACEAPSGVLPDIQRRLYVLYLMVSL